MLIVTLPAFALSDDVLNLKAPLGSAESLSVAPPAVFVGAAELVEAGAADDVDDVVLALFFLLLPQPPAATATTATAARTAMRFI
jgi:hypothetical protein